MTRLLLDNSMFPWLIDVPERLSPTARDLLRRGDTAAAVSAATLWT